MLDRMRIAWAVLRGQQLPDQMPLSTSLFPRQLGVYHINRRAKPSEQLAAYQAWVAAAVNVISMSIRQNRWFLCRQTGPDRDDIEKLADDQVPGVLKMPDKLFDLGTFLELSVKHLDTAGGSFWYKVTANGEPDGEIIGLQIIYPNQILPHFTNPAGLFLDWEVTIPGHPMVLVPIEDIIWTYRPNPSIPYYGASPVEQVALSHDLDLFAKAYSVAQLEGGGLPPGILSLGTTKLTDEKSDVVKARWRQQRQTPEDIAVLGDNAQWQAIGTSLQDLEWLALSRMTRDQVLAIYNCPAAKLGLVEDVNRANAIDVNRSFATDAIRPRLMMYEDSFNNFVMPGLGLPPDVLFRFDNPVEEDMPAAVTRAQSGLDVGAITVNEYRLETGREEIEGGDVYSIKGSRKIRENLEPDPKQDPADQNQLPAPGDQGEGEQGEGRAALPCHFTQVLALGAPTAREMAPANREIEGEAVEVFDLGLAGLNSDEVITTLQLRGLLPEVMPVSDRELRRSAQSFESAQGQLETKFLKQLRQLISAEQRQVVKRIRDRKTMPKLDSRGLQAADFEGDDAEIAELGITLDQTLMFEDLVDFGPEDDWEGLQQRDILGSVWERQTKSWINTYNRMLREGLALGWELLDEEVGRSLLPVEPALAASENRILNAAGRQVRRFRRTTRRQLARAIRKLFEFNRKAGVETTVDDVADEVSKTYDLIKGGRAATNARTDTSQSVNDGKARHMRAAEQRLPVTFIAVWNAILDEVTRPAHGRAHGQEREVPKTFSVGGEQLRYPLDPRGSAGNTINCRCTTTVQMRSKSDD